MPQITLQEAIDMTRLYRELRASVLNPIYAGKDIVANCETFDRGDFDSLLGQNNCARIRVYYGMTPDLKIHSVFVGVDRDGNEILPDESGSGGIIIEQAERCPVICPSASPLNS